MKHQIVLLVLYYLRFFARISLTRHKPQIIGIAGSVGKSSTRNILEGVLKDHFSVKVISGNSETGIPLSILGIKTQSLGFTTPLKSFLDWMRILFLAPFGIDTIKDSKYLIVEMGVDDPYPPKNMEYLLSIIKPAIALHIAASSGNAVPAHAMQFEKLLSKKEYAYIGSEEKAAFLIQKIADEDAKIITQSSCKMGIYNADDSYIVNSLEKYLQQKAQSLMAFGTNKDNDIVFGDYKVTLQGTSFTFFIGKTKENITIEIKNYLLPKEYQHSIAAVIAAALYIGLNKDQIKKSLENNFSLPYGRSSLFPGINGSVIIDSSYNASRVSVLPFLSLVKQLKQETKRSVVLAFGDMRELGTESAHEHEEVAQEMIGSVDYVYLIGLQTREYVLPILQQQEGAFKEIRWFANAKYLGEFLKENLPKDTIVLVKGSQNTIFLEEAVKYILKDKKDAKYLCRQEEYWKKGF